MSILLLIHVSLLKLARYAHGLLWSIMSYNKFYNTGKINRNQENRNVSSVLLLPRLHHMSKMEKHLIFERIDMWRSVIDNGAINRSNKHIRMIHKVCMWMEMKILKLNKLRKPVCLWLTDRHNGTLWIRYFENNVVPCYVFSTYFKQPTWLIFRSSTIWFTCCKYIFIILSSVFYWVVPTSNHIFTKAFLLTKNFTIFDINNTNTQF